MRSIFLLGVWTAAVGVRAHPTSQTSTSALNRRVVDLNAYRLKATPEYVDANKVASSPATVLLKRASYVDTATELLKSVVPGAEFRVVNDFYTGSNGISHVNFKQTAHGVDIDNADFNVNIGRDGTVFSYGNNFFTGTIPAENPLKKRAFSDPITALSSASNVLQLPVSGAVAAEAKEGVETYTLTGTSGAVSDPEARLVYFVKEDGTLALTWRVETDILDNWLLTYVDAVTNQDIHAVVDWVSHATFLVFPWGLNDPTEGDRVAITDPWDLTASPFTWLGDGTTNYTSTRGNNAIAQSNPSGGSDYLNNFRPSSPTQNFSYPYSSTMTPPSSYINASITQLFYTVNTYHDLLYLLGFTEAAGNFEVDDDGRGGVGNDFAIVNAQDGSGTNNANFATPPDGQPGRMRMYTWTTATPNRDGCLEAGIVIHEYTHGVSNRLTGGPANVNCLSTTEAGGMGEGWGDFMATLIRLKPADTRATNYPMGAWADNNPVGIRQYVYSTSLTTNPLTYTSANSLNEVHAIGTIWATMLYEVLWNLIDKYGKNDGPKPVFDADGVPTDGKYLTAKLVIDGMALQPCSPTFVSARDAILDADTALTGGANQCEIWTAFAKRGLGSGAVFNSTKRTGSTTIPAGVC